MLKELEPLAAQYKRSRETLLKALDSLDATQLEECLPGRDWSVKDTIIHIATNERLMTNLLKEIAEGTHTTLPEDFDNQHFNDEQVALGQNKSIAQLRADLDFSFYNLMSVLDEFTPEELEHRGVHPAAGDANIKEFLLAMYAHHEVHTRDVIEQARRLRAMP